MNEIIHTRHCCERVCIQRLVAESIQQPDILSNLACFSYRLLTSSCLRKHGVYFAPKRIKSAGYGPNHGFIVKSNLCCSKIEVLF